ncbi:LysM peptidoglycan-binding domain-containing protein [Spirobacillus cienkowskii]|uniref:LysM peptidoglycan-binding domain-containing protein n=1 Tax=Spirobacillus cienkowskii TaxID=495820 RepID=UPI0030D5A6B6
MSKQILFKIYNNLIIVITILLLTILNFKIYSKDLDSTINQENCHLYTVENGDYIIKILRKNAIYPIFGINGSLNQFYVLNNRKNSERKNLIKKGQVYCLPKIGDKSLNIEIKKTAEKDKFSNKNCTTYQVKKGDTLISILKSQHLFPVFGKKGSLNKTLAINNKETKNANFLKIKEILCLPNKIENESNSHEEDSKKIENNELLQIEHNFAPLISKNPIVENDPSLNENYKKFLEKNIKKQEDLKIQQDKSDENQENHEDQLKEKNIIAPIKPKITNKKLIIKKEPEKKQITCNYYKTKEGETYTEILRKNKLLPIYGEEGSFEKNLENNKHITRNNYTFSEGEELCLEKPVATTTVSKNNEEKNFQKVYSEIGSHYLRIIDEDPESQTRAVLLSRLLGRVELGLIQTWNSLMRTNLGIRYEASQIMQSETAIVIGESIFQLIHLNAGIQYQFNPKIYGKFDINYGDELVFRAIDFETIMLEKIPTTKFKLLGGYKLFENQYFNIYGEFGFSLHKPFENEVYKANFGKGYEFAVTANHQNEDWEFQSRLYFSRYWTVIKPINFNYTEVGISFTLATDLPN